MYLFRKLHLHKPLTWAFLIPISATASIYYTANYVVLDYIRRKYQSTALDAPMKLPAIIMLLLNPDDDT